MNLLILGRGKTGTLVAEVARERKHTVQAVNASENAKGGALSTANLAGVDLVLDFTTPQAVPGNIEACCAAGKSMVVGTTGWYADLPKVRQLVDKQGVGFLYGGNFSVGMNLFFDVVQAGAAALQHEYLGQIFERHHALKKDAPSGTAITLKKIVHDASAADLEIISFREGEVVGMHELVLDSSNDTIYLCHDSKSRRGFADGAVRGAEWLAGKKGFFEFKDVWRKV